MEGVRVTPFSAVHGFFGSSALKSSVQSLSEVPAELVNNAWMSGIIQQSQYVMGILAEAKESQAEQDYRQQSGSRTRSVQVGELVLLRKPFFERGAGLILPQADGPYIVHRVLNEHSVQLAEVLSGELLNSGRRVAISRLVRYSFPPHFAKQDLRDENIDTESYAVGEYIAVDVSSQIVGKSRRVSVARILRVFDIGDQLEILLFEVPSGERFGPWSRRPWCPLDVAAEQIPFSDVLCKVSLENGVLTTDSLDKLAHRGVKLSSFGREKTMFRGD